MQENFVGECHPSGTLHLPKTGPIWTRFGILMLACCQFSFSGLTFGDCVDPADNMKEKNIKVQ